MESYYANQIIDPENLPEKFLASGLLPVFIKRPKPEWIINISPERSGLTMTMIEHKKTGFFYPLPGYFPKAITQYATKADLAVYKIKNGGYALWPLEEYQRPGFTSAMEIANHFSDKWVRVNYKGKNGYSIETLNDQPLTTWKHIMPNSGEDFGTTD